MEDLGLVLGEAIAKAAGDKAGIRRYGNFLLPMDETLALIALDLSGRPCLVFDVQPPAPMIKDLDVRLFHEFFQALAVKSGMNLHVKQMAAGEVHHLYEAIFKGFAKALDQALSVDPRIQGVLSTKGSL
jgi:imidazoleglycerol-phosphate dehydratase